MVDVEDAGVVVWYGAQGCSGDSVEVSDSFRLVFKMVSIIMVTFAIKRDGFR